MQSRELVYTQFFPMNISERVQHFLAAHFNHATMLDIYTEKSDVLKMNQQS